MKKIIRKIGSLFQEKELPAAEPFDVWFSREFPPTRKLENAEEIEEALRKLQQEVRERTKPYD